MSVMSRCPRRAASVLTVSAALCFAAVPGSAFASPQISAAPRAPAATSANIAVVAAKVDALRSTAGDALELLSGAQLASQDAEAKLAVLTKQVAAAQAKVVGLQRTVDAYAAAAYMQGGMDPTLQLLGSPDISMLLQGAAQQQQIARLQDSVLQSNALAQTALAQNRSAASVQSTALGQARDSASQQQQIAQTSLAQAEQLLSSLKTEQRRELAALEAARAAAAARAARAATARVAAAAAAAQAVQQVAAQAAANRPKIAQPTSSSSNSNSGRGSQSSRGPGPVQAPPVSSSGSVGSGALRFAMSQIGKPYVWGAAGPSSYDCSGLVLAAFASVGVYLPHFTGSQIGYGSSVSADAMQPGDVVFFGYGVPSHVGIYIGGGQIVHSPRPGSYVSIVSINWLGMPISGIKRM